MALADLEAFKRRLGVAGNQQDEELQAVLDGVSAAVESWLQRKLLAADCTERHNGNGKNRLVLRQYPVRQVYSVKINGRAVDDWDNDDWLLIRQNGFSDGIRNICVNYRAGYDDIPADIAEAVLIIAVQRMNELENKGVQSKSLAGESITFSTFAQSGGMPPAAFEILQKYRRKG